MKKVSILVLFILILLFTANLTAQNRMAQKEIFGGVAFTMSPDAFKNFSAAGFSPNVQYVIFPKPRFGISFGVAYEKFTFDGEGFLQSVWEEDWTGTGPWKDTVIDIYGDNASGSTSNLEIGIGFRPYLTPPTSNIQFFALGMVTLNFFKNDINYDWGFDDWSPFSADGEFLDWPYTSSYLDPDLSRYFVWNDRTSEYEEVPIGREEILFDESATKIGFAAGAGVEIPAGDRFNVILQGLIKIIPSTKALEGFDIEAEEFDLEDKSHMFAGITLGIVF
jgi:opacity protein-like surface antigen